MLTFKFHVHLCTSHADSGGASQKSLETFTRHVADGAPNFTRPTENLLAFWNPLRVLILQQNN